MNQEIGFCRAKTLDNSKWVKGYHLVKYGQSHIYTYDTGDLIPVIGKTVNRDTGLKASYDKAPLTEIYERDFIVFNRGRYSGFYEQINALAPWIVLWNQNTCSFIRRRIFDSVQGYRLEAPLTRDIMSECEVIGNCIDNPKIPEKSAEQINKLKQEWKENNNVQ